MVRTKDELLEILKVRLEGDTSDEALSILEDVSDTLSVLEVKPDVDWKAKYEENDAAWRQRYKERFFRAEEVSEDLEASEDGETVADADSPVRFEDLFEVKGD